MATDSKATSPAPAAEALKFDQSKLENLLRRRFFIAPSFEIYGSAAGLFDFGPNGCAMKNAMETFWRRHFVMEEDLQEIYGPNLTPHPVLKASGHVDRFLDLMVEDLVTKECFRADKLIEDWIDKTILADPKLTAEKKDEVERVLNQLEGMSSDEMFQVITKYEIKSVAKNDLSKPYPFNLMFATKIGPKPGADDNTGVAYLRPETAQGIFVNFRRLYEQMGGRMPFGAACVGTSFRNEIAPRNGLLRVREFPMAEIEFFCDPLSKSPFAKFANVAGLVVPLFSREKQLANEEPLKISLGEAVERKIIDNETLAYFIGRTYIYLTTIGIKSIGLRFRQHLETEMAHYASDCWDAEILTSYKWVECVGIADRSAYDLSQHSKATNVELKASRTLVKPRLVEELAPRANRKLMGPEFKKDLADLLQSIEALTEPMRQVCKKQLEQEGHCLIKSINIAEQEYKVDKRYLAFEMTKTKITEETYVPNVIEPSFGIGRIFYALLEHSFRSRGLDDQEDRNYLALSPLIAPVKCSLLPISSQPQFMTIIEEIRSSLLARDIAVKIDASTASIGKRYARTDEIGIPFGVTVDFQTIEDKTVTLREICTMEQVRLPIREIPELLHSICRLTMTWEDVKGRYPVFEGQQLL